MVAFPSKAEFHVTNPVVEIWPGEIAPAAVTVHNPYDSAPFATAPNCVVAGSVLQRVVMGLEIISPFTLGLTMKETWCVERLIGL
jgi:hypothetical protein